MNRIFYQQDCDLQKLAGKTWRYELFYWDYVIGILLFSLVWALTAGSCGTEGRSFLPDLAQADWSNIGSAFLGGVVYGLYFYNKEVTLKRCIACVLTNTVLFTLLLTPIWLSIMYNIPLNSWAIWSARLMKLVITVPLQIATLYIVGKALPMAQLKRKLS